MSRAARRAGGCRGREGSRPRTCPLIAATRSDSPRSPEPSVALAPPTPSSLTSTSSRPSKRSTRTVACVGVRVLRHVGQRLGDHEVGGRLDCRGKAPGRRSRRRHRHGRAGGERAHRGLEPAVGEHRRMDAAREVAQLVEAQLELVDAAVEQRGRVGRRRARPCARGEGSARGRPAATGRRRGGCARAGGARRRPACDEAGARGVELDQARAQLGIEALVLQQQRGGRRRRRGPSPGPAPGRARWRPRARRGGRSRSRCRRGSSSAGQLDGRPGRVDVAAQLGHPERELERRVAERPRQARRAGPRARLLAELRHQRAHAARAREVGAREAGEERERRGGEGRERHPQQRVHLSRSHTRRPARARCRRLRTAGRGCGARARRRRATGGPASRPPRGRGRALRRRARASAASRRPGSRSMRSTLRGHPPRQSVITSSASLNSSAGTGASGTST